MATVSVLFLGLLLGMQHATEADHLAAMVSLAAGRATLGQTVRQGVAWGIGHTFTLLAVGGAVLIAGGRIPERVEQALELCVGLMLVLLGADVFRRMRRERIHFHAHRHADGSLHFHAHSHAGDGPHALSAHRHRHAGGTPVRALAVGMTHGLAGSAALVLLALGRTGSPWTGLACIATFGAGSVIGMAVLSAGIALPFRLTAARLGRLHAGLTAAAGAVSLALGASMVYRIGFAERLLTG